MKQKTPAKLQRTPAKMMKKLVENTQKQKSTFSHSNSIADKCALFRGEIVVDNEKLEIPARNSCSNLPSKPQVMKFEIVAGKSAGSDKPIRIKKAEINQASSPDWYTPNRLFKNRPKALEFDKLNFQ